MGSVKAVDYFYVPDSQAAIHARLEDWARWVRVKPPAWPVSPMFRQYRSKAWQWHVPDLAPQVNTLEAHATEKAVAALPAKQRDAVRWCYVFHVDPVGMARKLAVSKDGLLELVTDGRTMLKNRLALR